MRRVYLLAVPSALCLAVSCAFTLDFDKLQKEKPDAGGTAGANGGGGAAGVPLAELASTLATAECANLNACYVSAIRLIIHDEDCQSLFTSVIEDQTVAPIRQSVASGRVTYDPVKAAECVANLTRGTQQSPPVCANVNALLEDCKNALGNLGAADQSCGRNVECQRGLHCRLDGSCPGTCVPFRQVSEACQQDAQCDPTQGLYCQKLGGDAGVPEAGTADAGTPGSCQKYVAINAACTSQDQCVPGALCVNNVCRRLTELFTLAETYACFGNNLLCNPGLSCEFSGIPLLSAATCVAPKAATTDCRLALPDECPRDYYCNANWLNLAPGKCVASPTQDAPCATDAEQSAGLSAPCHSGLACVNGLCKPLRHLGEACEADAQCYSGACRAGSEAGGPVCVTPGCG